MSGVLVLLIAKLITVLSIARERDMRAFEQLLVSPMSATEIYIGNSLPAVLIEAVLGTVMMLAGVLILTPVSVVAATIDSYLNAVVLVKRINENDQTLVTPINGALKRKRLKAALANLYIGDALSMPVHWFYNPGDILRQFPPHGIQRLEAAPALHPSSIMALHSTSRGGRGKQGSRAQPEIIGDVILKGRRHLWGRPNGHYHHGMQAG